MDRVSDIFRSARGRFYSPLFLSFFSSWVLWNWKIMIALFWYDPGGIYEREDMSLFDYISANLDVSKSFIYPFVAAVGLTIAHPFIRNGIRLLYSWVNTIAENRNLKIKNEASVPMEKFVAMRADYISRREELTKILADENKTIADLEKERTGHLKARAEILQLHKKIEDMEKEREVVVQEYNDNFVFYQNRATLGSISNQVGDAQELCLLFFTGSVVDSGSDYNQYFKGRKVTLILLDPYYPAFTDMCKLFSKDVIAMRKNVLSLTTKAQADDVTVRWYQGPIGSSLVICDPESAGVSIRMEMLVPFGGASARPSIKFNNISAPATVTEVKRAFWDMFNLSVKPTI